MSAVVPLLALFGMAAFRLMPSINRIVSMVTQLRYYRSSIDVVCHELASSSEASGEERAPRLATNTTLYRGVIKLSDVSYCYPGGDSPAIRNVSLTIYPGRSVAFVGPTGGGKTTLLDVILGLLTPTCGTVRVNGVSVHEYTAAWQAGIGYIPQTIYLLDDSIRRNVAFGVVDADIDDDRVWEVLRLAQLANFVAGLPDQLDARVGERGARLSGGERQRLGIARALYREPQVLVLDEATSALDEATEREVTKALSLCRKGRTLLVVAHRLTSVSGCDDIFLIDQGRMMGRVSYSQLLAQTQDVGGVLASTGPRS